MSQEPHVDLPLFIPEDIAEAYRDEVTLQVTESWAGRPAPVVRGEQPPAAGTPSHAAASNSELVVLLAINIALVGWAVCTGWWAWLAVDSGSTMWLTIAAAGVAGLVVGVYATARFWLSHR